MFWNIGDLNYKVSDFIIEENENNKSDSYLVNISKKIKDEFTSNKLVKNAINNESHDTEI